jgi:16S rRNA (cytosine1402-N4)-methyltransferase
MVREALDFLAPSPGDVIADCTAGAGGHARAILERILPGGRLIAIDRDPEMLALARKNLGDLSRHARFFQASFTEIAAVLSQVGHEKVNGMLFDLGVSSVQLDDPSRGLSFQQEGPLDMRLDRSSGIRAYDVVNTFSEARLADVFWEFGEERWSRRIARAIVRERSKGPITGTTQLARLVQSTIGGRAGGIHPATRCFMALRILVNSEISSLRRALSTAYEDLGTGARIVVISFHSLEDRIVKDTFREQARSGLLKVLTPKVVRPTEEETTRNARSRSAKLRAAERTAVQA